MDSSGHPGAAFGPRTTAVVSSIVLLLARSQTDPHKFSRATQLPLKLPPWKLEHYTLGEWPDAGIEDAASPHIVGELCIAPGLRANGRDQFRLQRRRCPVSWPNSFWPRYSRLHP